jgi:prenylated cyclic peptide (anacyclamide/piricyclamide family)
MTKKNLKPQQAAPVQREINTTSSGGGTGLTLLNYSGGGRHRSPSGIHIPDPFAGDDAD